MCNVLKRDQIHYRQEDIEKGTLRPFELTPDLPQHDHFYYGVRIVTGSQTFAGTQDTDIYITLVGDKAASEEVKIVTGWFSPTVATQTFNDLLIESNLHLGEVLVVNIVNPKNWLITAGSSWHVDFVDVIDLQTKQLQVFPCYHWIDDGDEVSLTSKTTTLNNIAGNAILKKQRSTQLNHRKLKYEWQAFPASGLPSGVQNLPSDDKFEAAKSIDFTVDGLAGSSKIKLKTAFMSITSLHQYEELATILQTPEFETYAMARWTRDEEFGRQILNGVNPVVLQQCTSLPPNFPVTNELVEGSLGRGLSLEGEMEAGHLYICNMKMFDGLECKKGWFCAAPICLLYVNKHEQLVPIAIQLKQQPGKDNPIFLPSDNWADWLLAKMYYQSAHGQFHHIAVHYIYSHLSMETFGVAVMRNLPDAHPVFKLLRPHLRYTMAINAIARKSLVSKGGLMDQIFAISGEGRSELMRRSGAAYSVHWANMKRSPKERGVNNPSLLPGYYYRDDGLKIWQAVEDFVSGVINVFYSSDKCVTSDPELQSWADDLYTNGFPGYGGKQGHGFPKVIESKAQLIELCTLIIFTGSTHHGSVNYGMYDTYSFTPSAPCGMRIPPPTQKGKANLQTLLDALPDKDTACTMNATGYLLSQYSSDEIFFGNFPAVRFVEPNIQSLITQFKMNLEKIDNEIKERNKSLDVPYIYMLPSKTPNSITI